MKKFKKGVRSMSNRLPLSREHPNNKHNNSIGSFVRQAVAIIAINNKKQYQKQAPFFWYKWALIKISPVRLILERLSFRG
tara:strand:+ start:317 stop:556 length:240 start_codon:yes stop_codon:yes gene_type:complete